MYPISNARAPIENPLEPLKNLLIESIGVPIQGVPHFQVNILQVGALATVQNLPYSGLL